MNLALCQDRPTASGPPRSGWHVRYGGTIIHLVDVAGCPRGHEQLWSVLSVQDAERRRRLAELAGGQAHVRDCGLFLVWLADLRRLGDLAEHRGVGHDNASPSDTTAATQRRAARPPATAVALSVLVAARCGELGCRNSDLLACSTRIRFTRKTARACSMAR